MWPSCKTCLGSKGRIWDDVSPARAAADDSTDLLRRFGGAGLAVGALGDCAEIFPRNQPLRGSLIEHRRALDWRRSGPCAHRSRREFLQEAVVLPIPLPDWFS